jgi:hypothetical protein
VTLWLSGWDIMASPAIPVPLRDIARIGSVASLAMETLPEAFPELVGANST